MDLIIKFEPYHWFILGMYAGIFISVISILIVIWKE